MTYKIVCKWEETTTKAHITRFKCCYIQRLFAFILNIIFRSVDMSKWMNASWCFGNVQLLRTVVIVFFSFFLSFSLTFLCIYVYSLYVRHSVAHLLNMKIGFIMNLSVCQTEWKVWRHNNDSQLNPTCVQHCVQWVQCCSWNELTNLVAWTMESN